MQDNKIKARVRLQSKLIFLFILYVRTRKEMEWKQEQDTSVHTQTWYIRPGKTAAPSLLQVCQLGETVRRPRGPLNLTTHSFQFRYFYLSFLTSLSHESRKTKFMLFSFFNSRISFYIPNSSLRTFGFDANKVKRNMRVKLRNYICIKALESLIKSLSVNRT